MKINFIKLQQKYIYMDHKIENLGECIFDYLSSHPEKPKTFVQIFNDISGSTGHRCTELQNLSKRKQYKDRFMTICYTLDTDWNNIHKIFMDNVLFLVYSTKSHSEVINELHSDVHNLEYHNVDDFELETVIDYMLENQSKQHDHSFELQNKLNIDGDLLKFLVRKNKLDKLTKVLGSYDVELNTNDCSWDSLVNIAIENSHSGIVKVLMKNNFKNKKKVLKMNIDELKKLNTKLQNENTSLSLKNQSLKEELNVKSNWKGFLGMVMCFIFVGFAMSI